MSYLLQEISFYLFVAFIVGAVYGWVVRSLRSKHNSAHETAENLSRHKDHEQALQVLRAENESLRDRIEQLELIPASGAEEDWQDGYDLNVITDIETSTLKKLTAQEITTTKQLWKHCDSEEAVLKLAEKIGVEDFAIQRWVSISDLLRVANIEAADAELLELTEIYSMQDLAAQKPQRLAEKLTKNNESEKILDAIPAEEKLAKWIEHAQHIVSKS